MDHNPKHLADQTNLEYLADQTNSKQGERFEPRRGVSPVIGYVLVTVAVISIGAVVVASTGWIPGTVDETDVTDRTFDVAVENTSAYTIEYTSGPPMTGTDTKELRFVPEVEESFTVSPSEWDGHRLEPGDPVRKTLAERIELGQSVQIVRVEVNGDEERIDTVSVPTERWVTIETGTGEQAGRTGGSANVSIEIE